MEKKSLAPYGIVLFLMILASFALAFTVDVNLSGKAGIRFEELSDGDRIMYLPDQVGDWQGERFLYCQNPDCRKGWSVKELQDLTICPECGGRLDALTQAEKDALPLDTEMVKKRYIRDGEEGDELFVNIVLSGKSRSSIHRPQRCLIAQGSTIDETETLDIPVEDDGVLEVKLIKNTFHKKISRNKEIAFKRYFVYWFIGRGRETESHLERMAMMAMDRVFYNVAHRWAYISISGGPSSKDVGEDEYIEKVKSFISEIHPQIVLKDV